MSSPRPGYDAILPRRRFLQALCVVPAIVRPGAETPVRLVTHPPTTVSDDLVEYRGWIVRASDRARLEAGALQ